MKKLLTNKTFLTALRLGIALLSVAYILFKTWQYSRSLKFGQVEWFYMILAVLLMPVNWLLEAFKWHTIVRNYETITFRRAVQSVLLGFPYAVLTPWRVGEWYGRTSYLQDKTTGTLAGALAGYVQQTVTFAAGIAGLCLLLCGNTGIFTAVFVAGVAFPLSYAVVRFSGNKLKFLRPLSGLPSALYVKALAVAVLRYAVFSTQYVLLFKFLSSNIGVLELYKTVFLVYLGVYMLPVNGLSDLGLRSSISVALNSGIMAVSAAVAPGILIWLINVALPTLIGSIFTFGKQ